jgi:hypothetical protein
MYSECTQTRKKRTLMYSNAKLNTFFVHITVVLSTFFVLVMYSMYSIFRPYWYPYRW